MNKNIMKIVGFGVLFIILVIGVLAAFRFVAESNAIKYELKVQNAYEDIATAERNRYDTVVTLADAAKAEAKVVTEAYIRIAEAKANIEGGKFEEANSNLNTAVSAIAEAYPDFKLSDAYKDFRTEVVICNRDIETNRKAYNKYVREYQSYIRSPFWRGIISKTGYKIVEFEEMSKILGDNRDMPEIDWSIE